MRCITLGHLGHVRSAVIVHIAVNMIRYSLGDTIAPFNPVVVASVGGLVIDNERLLVVRHTYPPSTGKYMLPGGVVDPGEMLDAAAVREVVEETGVVALPVGIVGVASIVHEGVTHAYVFWLMTATEGAPQADGLEADHCCYMSFEEIAAWIVRMRTAL